MREKVKPCPSWAESGFSSSLGQATASPLHLQPALLSEDGLHISDDVQEHSEARSEIISIPLRDVQ